MKRRPLLVATAAWPSMARASPQALVAAAEAGDLAALRRMLEAGTPVDGRDGRDGRQRTALLAATQANRIDAARLLIERGANVNVNHVNRLGWTALLEAIILGDGGAAHTEIVRLLVARGANVNLADAQGVTPLAHAEQRGQAVIADGLRRVGARR